MTIPQSLSRAMKAAERTLSENENKHYRHMLSFYSTMLLGDMMAQSGHNTIDNQPNESYSFQKVVEFVTRYFPLSAYIQSLSEDLIVAEVKDIAWEIEGCVMETITFIVNELSVNPYTMRQYDAIPAPSRLRARRHLSDQLVALSVPMDHIYVRPFIMGLLAHRWKLFATSLESPFPQHSSVS